MLEQRGDSLHCSFELGIGLDGITSQPDRRLHEAFSVCYLENFAALNSFDQHLDIAVGQLKPLNDVDHCPDLINLI